MQFLSSLRRAIRWHRRGLAALLVAIAVLAGLNTLNSHATTGPPVVVAQRDIAAGAIVSASDLAVVALPPAMVPDGAFTDVAQATGRSVVVGVPARQVLTTSALLGERGQVSPGQVALPVGFPAAATSALLRVGSRIDVLGPDASGSGYGVVAAGVRVAAIPAAEDAGMLTSNSSRLVLLEVSSTQAAAIAASMAVSSLSFAVH